MASKQEMEALWADLSRRASTDSKLLEVIESIDKNVARSSEDDRQHRLRVPYANANVLGNEGAWN